MPALLRGLFSQAGRATEHDLSKLREFCNVQYDDDDDTAGNEDDNVKRTDDASNRHPPKGRVGLASSGHSGSLRKASAGQTASQTDTSGVTPASPQRGELARAILERVQHNLAAAGAGGAATSGAGAAAADARSGSAKAGEALQEVRPGLGGASVSTMRKDLPTSSFSSQGMEAWWTTKFAASHDVGSINRREEQRPDPGWYRMHYDAVHERYPAWDIAGPRRASRSPSPGNAGTGDGATAFLTDVDFNERNNAEAPRHERRGRSESPPLFNAAKDRRKTQWQLATGRQPLGKIGRVHVIGQEVSAPAADVLQQDIKGYHKLRYPEWDFASASSRPPLMKGGEDKSCPGRYDVQWSCVDAPVKTGVAFDRALSRDVCVRNLGKISLARVLHPDEECTQKTASTRRRPIQDRSSAKDAVRRRIVHVNDMTRELDRPPLPVTVQEYHDKNDPEADAVVMERLRTYDCDKADVPVTKRRDTAPDFSRMLPRGRAAVQGLRALSGDTGVRGSVGIGFVETTGQLKHDVALLEGRKVTHGRPDQGPRFDKYSLFKPLHTGNNFNHGYPHVHRPKIVSKRSLHSTASAPVFYKHERKAKAAATTPGE